MSNAEHQDDDDEENPYLQVRCQNREGPTQQIPHGSALESPPLTEDAPLAFLSPFHCFCSIPLLIAFIL